jgi:hypothetical protein
VLSLDIYFVSRKDHKSILENGPGNALIVMEDNEAHLPPLLVMNFSRMASLNRRPASIKPRYTPSSDDSSPAMDTQCPFYRRDVSNDSFDIPPH